MEKSSANILIVDDTPNNLRLLTEMLSAQGYKVRAVLNGVRALRAIQSTLPDLILLDVMMPEMDGYEVCEMLKDNPQTRDIPIIFISALGETEDKLKAFKIGGVDYISKPFQVAEVLARVKTHLALKTLHEELQVQVEDMAQLNAQLETRNQDLDAFAHTVAHDLRNPINLLIGYADLLCAAPALEGQPEHEYALAIAKTSAKLASIVESLLLLAGPQRNDPPQTEPLNMHAIIAEAWRRVSAVYQGPPAQFKGPAYLPTAKGYAPWVEQVWVNLLENALKYGGEPPRLEVGAELDADGFIRFWVHDNGSGLTPEQQKRLFTPFERLDPERGGGYGLGLSIVRRIIEKLGGVVGVQSAPGQGAAFYFTLPAAQSA